MKTAHVIALAATFAATAATAAPLPQSFAILRYSNLLYMPASDSYDVEQENVLVNATASLSNAGSTFPVGTVAYAQFEQGGEVGSLAAVNGRVDASTSSRLTYWFRINSRTNRNVRLFVRAAGSAAFSSQASGFASGQWYLNGNLEDATFANAFDQSDAFAVGRSLVAQTNTIYKVEMDTSVQLNGIVPGQGIPFAQGIATSFIDPRFRVLGDDATLEFSDGITGATFVPEPATWATMIIGFGLVGAAARRARPAARA